MTKRVRIFRNIAIGLVSLLVLLGVGTILVVRTQWFRDYVRAKIISTAEEATGGKVEIGSFSFDWTHLRAYLHDFVIHGLEPPGAAPLFRVRSMQLDLKILSSFKRTLDLQYLAADQPQANIIVFPDGRTNVPAPKVKSKNDTSALETIVDLAIGKFELTNGAISVAEQKTPFNLKGQNLRAHLDYNLLTTSYKGEISMDPVYASSGKNTPVRLHVTLPVTIEKDRIQFANAKITSPKSEVVISGSMEHMAAPRASAHVNARLALDEIQSLADLKQPLAAGKGIPNQVNADVALVMDNNSIRISTSRFTLGQSSIEASGTLKDPSNNGSVQFNTRLALGELGRLLRLTARPDGLLEAGGNARLIGQSDYAISAKVNGRGLAFRQGQTRFSNISLLSEVSADPKKIALSNLKLSALGGEFTGAVNLLEMTRFQLHGQLHHFDMQQLARVLANERIGYSGVISGPVDAQGDLRAPGLTGIRAHTRLAIAPGRHGVPVSGKLNAAYNGASGLVDVGQSYITLPNSRLDLSGSLGRQIQVKLVSRNLNDFQPAMAMGSKAPPKELPIALKGGSAVFTGALTGTLSAPRLNGHVEVTKFALEDRPFDQFAADLNVSNSGATVQNGTLTRGALQAQFAGALGLHQWNADPRQPLSLNTTIRNGDLADLLALAGFKNIPLRGNLNATAQLTGTVGNPRGNANLTVVNGTAYDEPFDRLDAALNFSDQVVNLTSAAIAAPAGRVDLNGVFQHPKESLSTGNLQLHLASSQISLDQLRTLRQDRPGLAGKLQLNGDASARLQTSGKETELQVTSVNANLNARGFQMEGQNYGDLTATAQTSGNTVNYKVDSDFAKSTIHIAGQTHLEKDYPTTAAATISGLPIERVLALAGRKDIPAIGLLNANGQVAGTLNDPRANFDLTLTKAVIYQEPLDRLQTHINYSAQLVDVPSFEVTAGPNRLNFTGAFAHPKNDFETGQLKFHLASNGLQLARIQTLEKQRPGLAGVLQLAADGAATLQKPAAPSNAKSSVTPTILLSNLNATANATNITMNKQQFGDIKFSAQTKGSALDFTLDSDFAKSSIHGSGQAQLQGDYPLTAQLNFTNLRYSGLQPFLSLEGSGTRPDFDALAEGQLSISGSALKTEDLKGRLEVAKLQVFTTPRNVPGSKTKSIALQNQGPILVALDRSVVKVESARITGPSTNIVVAGAVSLKDKTPLDLTVNADTNLVLLQDVSKDIYSSGNVDLKATIRGSFADPRINGSMDLKNASFNLADLPNGISKANGTILFNGTNATIQNLTGESGGGKVTVRGFVGFAGGTLGYGLKANADNVRVRYPEGTSIVGSTALNLTGTSDRSLLSGTVMVQRIGFNPHSDFGSILSRSSQPVQTLSAPTGLLSGMKLDIRVRTATDVAFDTALAQNIQAEADLRLRGTLASPGVLGRIVITEGDVIFFGTKYAVNQGTIAFFNPLKIEPILNINLQTKARGVDVVLTVSGPIDNMTLAYRSDPPLQFQEVVALLAADKTPTSDPTIAAHQPAEPPQSFQQMGESAIVSQAVAAPLSSRLQRVFGVSKLKIDPTFTSGSELPQARLTLQQQVSNSITFTYVTNLTQTNSQILRVEWALNPQWSAIATREENGLFGVDFFYKKQFR